MQLTQPSAGTQLGDTVQVIVSTGDDDWHWPLEPWRFDDFESDNNSRSLVDALYTDGYREMAVSLESRSGKTDWKELVGLANA